MLSGAWLIILLVLAIVFIVLMTGKVRMNAFIVLLLAAIFVGLLAGHLVPKCLMATVPG